MSSIKITTAAAMIALGSFGSAINGTAQELWPAKAPIGGIYACTGGWGDMGFDIAGAGYQGGYYTGTYLDAVGCVDLELVKYEEGTWNTSWEGHWSEPTIERGGKMSIQATSPYDFIGSYTTTSAGFRGSANAQGTFSCRYKSDFYGNTQRPPKAGPGNHARHIYRPHCGVDIGGR